MARIRKQDRQQAWIVNPEIQRSRLTSATAESADTCHEIVVHDLVDFCESLESQPACVKSSLDRLHLFTCESGTSLVLGDELIHAEEMLAYVNELRTLADRLRVGGKIVLHRSGVSDVSGRFSPANHAVQPGIVQSLRAIAGVAVILDRGGHQSSGDDLKGRANNINQIDGKTSLRLIDHTSVFDLKRSPSDPGPPSAKRGDVVQHSVDIPLSHARGSHLDPLTFELELASSETFLGGGPGSFWRPVLLNPGTPEEDARELSVILGDSTETVQLRDTLGMDLAVVVASATESQSATTRLHGRLDRQTYVGENRSHDTGTWRLVFYCRVMHGSLMMNPRQFRLGDAQLSQVTPAGQVDGDRMILHPHLPHTHDSSQPGGTRRRTERPGSTWRNSIRVDRPHRSQASKPANYQEVLRSRHLSWRRYKTAASDLE